MKTEECKKWLADYLKRQAGALVEDTRAEAKKKGFTKLDLKTARKELGVKTFHQFDEGGQAPNYFWYLKE